MPQQQTKPRRRKRVNVPPGRQITSADMVREDEGRGKSWGKSSLDQRTKSPIASTSGLQKSDENNEIISSDDSSSDSLPLALIQKQMTILSKNLPPESSDSDNENARENEMDETDAIDANQKTRLLFKSGDSELKCK